MNRKTCTILAFSLLLFGCGDKKGDIKTDHLSKLPKDMKGLVVEGPRPKDNVIYNIAPIMNHWRQMCHQTDNNNCKGKIKFELSVSNVGEISVNKYTHTLADSQFVIKCINGLYMRDFDPWNDDMSDTKIMYTVDLSE